MLEENKTRRVSLYEEWIQTRQFIANALFLDIITCIPSRIHNIINRKYSIFDKRKRNFTSENSNYKVLDPIKRLTVLALFSLYQILFIVGHRPVTPTVLCAIFLISLVSELCLFNMLWFYECTKYEFKRLDQLKEVSNQLKRKIINWIKAWKNPISQCLLFAFLVVSAIIILVCVDQTTESGFMRYPIDVYIFIPIIIFGSQGIYWGIAISTMADCIDSEDLVSTTHPLYYNRSPIIISMSNILAEYSVRTAILITLDIIILVILRSEIHDDAFIYPVVGNLLGYIVSVWIFLAPQFKFSALIRKAKEITLLKLESEIFLLQEKSTGKKDEFEKV